MNIHMKQMKERMKLLTSLKHHDHFNKAYWAEYDILSIAINEPFETDEEQFCTGCDIAIDRLLDDISKMN